MLEAESKCYHLQWHKNTVVFLKKNTLKNLNDIHTCVLTTKLKTVNIFSASHNVLRAKMWKGQEAILEKEVIQGL